MKRENVALKKAILARMPEKDYNALIRMMADDIYNKVDYDVIILLARKCSSLYMGMLPLMKEERDGLIAETHRSLVDKQGGKEPIVLTDRAIDWVIWCISQSAERKIRKILLVDDIIIHGRTLLRTKKKIQRAFKDAGIEEFQIDIEAFAVNKSGLLIAEEEIANLSDIRRYTVKDWHIFSGQIVDTIYLTGQTYTSYIPKICFPINSKSGHKIRQFIDKEKVPQITDRTKVDLGVKIYASVIEGQEKNVLCESYRIYEFLNQGKYVIIPMVSLQAVNEELLDKYMDALIASEAIVLKESEEEDSLERFLEGCSGVYRYRLVLYVISAFCGWRFLRERIGINDAISFDEIVEEQNFYLVRLKNYSDLGQKYIEDLLKKLETEYTGTVHIKDITTAIGDDDVKHLTESLGKIIEEEREKSTDVETVGKLLTINHIMDENKYQESVKNDETDIQDRVRGIPLIDIVDALVNNKKMDLPGAICSILTEVDYGRGSIVEHCFTTKSESQWYTSLIHAGEENYRYYIRNYLPVLYGLCMLEFRCEGMVNLEQKEEYWQLFYEKNPEIGYLEDDKTYLIQTGTLQKLKNVVEEAALYQPLINGEKKALSSAIQMSGEYA